MRGLRNAGYRVKSARFPSGRSPRLASSIEAAQQEIAQLSELNEEIVIVCHVLTTVPEALNGLSKTARNTEGQEGGVTCMIFISGAELFQGPNSTNVLGEYQTCEIHDDKQIQNYKVRQVV
jgi:hypothetical protein